MSWPSPAAVFSEQSKLLLEPFPGLKARVQDSANTLHTLTYTLADKGKFLYKEPQGPSQIPA